MRRDRLFALLLCAALMAGAAACDTTSKASAKPESATTTRQSVTGTLTGVLQSVGGPAPGPATPMPGTVVIDQMDGTTVTAQTGADGRFSTDVLPGVARVTGRSPHYENATRDCDAVPTNVVQIRAGETTRVTIDCQLR